MLFRYRLVRTSMQFIRTLLGAQVTVVGQENIPAQGPYIVVLNHTSVVDTPVLLMAFPVMRWRFFAVEKWKYHPIYGPIMAWLGAIYLRRDEVDRQQLREALAALEAGIVFGLAPEARRSFTGKMMAAKDGAAYLATRVNVPILPVGLVNNDVLFANVKQWQRTQIEVRVGRPFHLPDMDQRVRSKDLPAYTHLIMIQIAALLPKRYHGYYEDSPALAALLRGEDPWPYCQALTA